MEEDTKQLVEEARERGRFEGEVLTSLHDIKITLDDMKMKHTSQDIKIDAKAERSELEELKKKVYQLSGAAAAISFLASKIWS